MQIANDYDVIVAGGGPGGIMAALASARMHVKTLLVERSAFLGGSATLSRIGPISPFHYKDEQVVHGLPQEFVDGMVKAGGATGHMKCLNSHGTGDYVCVYDHEVYKIAARNMLLDAGVDLLFHAVVSSVVKEGNCLKGVRISSRFGCREIRGRIVIDATGDGDVACLAGEAFVYGDGQGKAQPSSAMFEMANVDTERLYRYILENRKEFGRLSDLVPFRDTRYRDRKFFVAQGYQSLVDQAKASGELVFGRENIHTTTGLRPGIMHFNTARISNYDTTDLFARSESELEGSRQIESVAGFMVNHVPGYEHAYISSTGNEVGVRESRHICGVYRLTGEDILTARRFPDVIARGLFAVDIHGRKAGEDGDIRGRMRKKGQEADGLGREQQQNGNIQGAGGLWKELRDAYDIPYRILVPARTDGLLLAGRCVSADYVAFSSLRVQGTLMGYSQAAGYAAALCVRENLHPRDLPADLLQKQLVLSGASPYRDPERKKAEEAYATERVRAFLAARPVLITPECFLEKYREA